MPKIKKAKKKSETYCISSAYDAGKINSTALVSKMLRDIAQYPESPEDILTAFQIGFNEVWTEAIKALKSKN